MTKYRLYAKDGRFVLDLIISAWSAKSAIRKAKAICLRAFPDMDIVQIQLKECSLL